MWIRLLEGGIGVVGIVLTVFALFSSDNSGVAPMAIGLSVIAVGSVAVAIVIQWQVDASRRVAARKDAWSEQLPKVHSAALRLAGMRVNAGRTNAAQRASEGCLEFAGAFSAVSGRDCRVTVKEVYSVDQSGETLLARDLISPTKVHFDSGPDADRVDENSDFTALALDGARVYFCNDLVDELRRGYKNSHWTTEKLQAWERSGEYPYRATIVWPIRARRESDSGKSRWEVVGLLCIDSARAGTFDADYDVVVGELFATALMSVWDQITGTTDGVNLAAQA